MSSRLPLLECYLRQMVRSAFIICCFTLVVAPDAAQGQNQRVVKNVKPPALDLEPKDAGVHPIPQASPTPDGKYKTLTEILREDAARPHFDRAQTERKRQRELGTKPSDSGTQHPDDLSTLD